MYKNINGLDSCGMNKPAIIKFHVFFFDDVGNYRYLNDNLNEITQYDSKNQPETYRPNKSLSFYSGSQNKGNFKVFSHQLTVNFPRMESVKRNEFFELYDQKLTIIFEDYNGNSWIMGKDFAAKMISLAPTTGAKEGSNDYTVVFESTEKEQLQLIQAPDEDCFSSVFAEKTILSYAEFEDVNVSAYSSWQNLQFAANQTPYSFNYSPVLSPLYWNLVPSLKIDNEFRIMQSLQSTGANVSALTLELNAPATASILIESSDTAFGAFFADSRAGTNQANSESVNFNLTLSPNLQNSGTSIRLSDSNGIIFEVPFGDSVGSFQFITGTSENFNIGVTQLYGQNQETLTLELVGLDCPEFNYIYSYESTLKACVSSVDFDFFRARKHKIFIPYVQYSLANNTGTPPPIFQNIHINAFGVIYEMYKNINDWHNDFNLFKDDLTDLISQSGANLINVNSLDFSDNGDHAEISFSLSGVVADIENPFFRTYTNFSENFQALNGQLKAVNSRALYLQTAAPISATIKHEDELGNEIEGTNIVNVTNNNTFDLQAISATSNQSIDKIAVLWAFDQSLQYVEQSKITTNAISNICLTPTVETETKRCLDSFGSVLTHYFILASMDASSGSVGLGNVFQINTAKGSQTIATPIEATPTGNAHYTTNLFNTIEGVQVVHYEYNAINMTYDFYLMIEQGVILNSIDELKNGRSFNLSFSINPIFTNKTYPNINPFVKLNWADLPTISGNYSTGLNDLTVIDWSESINETAIISFDWNVNSDDLIIKRIYQTPTFVSKDINIDIYSFIDFPQIGVSPVFSVTLSAGNNSQSYNGLTAALGNLNNGGYIVYTDSFGITTIIYMVFSSDAFYELKHKAKSPLVWGAMDLIRYVGGVTDIAPIEDSAECGCSVCVTNGGVTVGWNKDDEVGFVQVEIQGTNKDLVSEISATLEPNDGGSDADPDEYALSLVSETPTTAVWRSDELQFVEGDNVYDMEYLLHISVKDNNAIEVINTTELVIFVEP